MITSAQDLTLRPVVAERAPRQSTLAIANFDRVELPAIAAAWTGLAARSAEDNVYYAQNYVLPLLDTVEAKTPVRFITAWDGDKLMAFMPVVLNKRSIPGVLPAGRAWESDYTFGCTPLLDRDNPGRAAQGLVDALADLGGGDWSLPHLNTEGPVWQAFTAALDRRNIPWLLNRPYTRAMLTCGKSFEDHMQTYVGAKRRRELARNRRRLEGLGVVSHKSCSSGAGLEEAVETFLKLEASGWKGRCGTALACEPETADFARRAFGPAAGPKATRADLLLLDDQPIAAGLIVFSGNTGFTVKGAYDETYAQYGAGLLLEVEVIKSFLEERWAGKLDAATNGAHVIDRLWPGRTSVGELVFSFARRAPRLRIAAYQNCQKWKAETKNWVKRAINRP